MWANIMVILGNLLHQRLLQIFFLEAPDSESSILVNLESVYVIEQYEEEEEFRTLEEGNWSVYVKPHSDSLRNSGPNS